MISRHRACVESDETKPKCVHSYRSRVEMSLTAENAAEKATNMIQEQRPEIGLCRVLVRLLHGGSRGW
jgi:hypothetical protein